MSNELKQAASSFSEQSKKYQIAIYYTHGDEERAKQMLAGAIQDLYVVKANFSSSSMNGAFVVFLESSYYKFIHGHILLLKTYELEDLKTTRDWRNFEKQLVEIGERIDYDRTFSNQMRESLASALTIQEITAICRKLDNDDSISVNHDFQKIVSDVAGLQNVEIKLDYEKISSLSMELHSITSRKIPPAELARAGKKPDADGNDIVIQQPDDPLAGKQVKLTLSGALILSPIKGKHISSLHEGDRIMVSLVDKNPKAIDVAKAFNAYDEEGNIKPIPGRIVSITHRDNYVIFVIVAKGIYVKIVEEEDNIKVALDPAYSAAQGEAVVEESKRNGLKVLVLGLVFFTLVAVVLFFVFWS